MVIDVEKSKSMKELFHQLVCEEDERFKKIQKIHFLNIQEPSGFRISN